MAFEVVEQKRPRNNKRANDKEEKVEKKETKWIFPSSGLEL